MKYLRCISYFNIIMKMSFLVSAGGCFPCVCDDKQMVIMSRITVNRTVYRTADTHLEVFIVYVEATPCWISELKWLDSSHVKS